MKRPLLALSVALIFAGCSPSATTTTSATATSATTTSAAFTINPLTDADNTIQGCTRSLSRVGAAPSDGALFIEDGIATGAKGYIRIDGALITVDLVSANDDEHGGVRTFADAGHTLEIVETLTNGAAHEESDSVEQSGAIAVAAHGATQTIQVEGGTAC